MKKIIKIILLSTILLYSSSYAAIGYWGNHPVNYTSPGLTNLGGTGGPNRGTLCTDDGDGDGSNNKLALGNSSTTTDPETGLIPISPSGTMNCLFYDATPPNGAGSYDLTQLHSANKRAIITMTCNDNGGSNCDSTTNDSVTSGQGWTKIATNTYQKVCNGLDLSNTVTISNSPSASCGGPITFRDIAGNITSVVYSSSTGSVTSDTSSKLMVKGVSQFSGNSTASAIKSNEQSQNASVKDNFSKINKLNLKTTILKNVEQLLKSINRNSVSTTSITINNINNIVSADKIITSGSKTLYYFKDKEITINNGVHNINKNMTIIIERGNLNIKGNINYQNGGMLGLILLGNKNGTNSNIFVDENISNGAGIIYTDGTIQSTFNSGPSDDNIYTSSNINDRGLNQLYWKGSFISQNTIGGSIGTYKCPYGSINYKSCSTQATARKYDLLFFRRYSLIDGSKYYGITSSAGTPFSITSVPFGTSDRTIYISGGRGYIKSGSTLTVSSAGNGSFQDKNISNSFILDYDSRITGKSAPLGFSSN